MTTCAMARYEEHSTPHIPVLLEDVLKALRPKTGGTYIDGTFGRGGYTRALLDSTKDTQVFAIDRDPQAIAFGQQQIAPQYPDRLTLIQGNFDAMDELMRQQGLSSVDGVMLDLGVSSPQIDDAERGFSFMKDAPLDMRMDNEKGISAAELVNQTPEEELANILYRYGEEHKSRRVARAIIEARQEKPITHTLQLAHIIHSVLPKTGKNDPAMKSFQALRIAVNDELGSLERGLKAAENILVPGGVLAVVSFHSLEDRMVKTFMRERSGSMPSGSRHLPQITDPSTPRPSFDLLKKSALKPSETESHQNPRSRSARLRVAIRTDAPSFQGGAL